MLQQTRVETVLPYFEQFMLRFPTVRALADAPIDQVLHAWSGLGYYRRARMLHAAAQVLRDQHQSRLPQDLEALRALPGVGAYTAAAIASLAFGINEPVVDGNVKRVMARFLALTIPVSSPAFDRRLEPVLRQLMHGHAAGNWNEAVMDLGATVCLPRESQCAKCPLEDGCQARERGLTHQLPVAGPRQTARAVPLTCFVVTCDRALLVGQRPNEGLFGGLWEPLMVQGPWRGEAVRSVRAKLGVARVVQVGHFEHVLSHRVLKVTVLSAAVESRAALAASELGYAAVRWVTEQDTVGLGMSTLARRALAMSNQANAAR